MTRAMAPGEMNLAKAMTMAGAMRRKAAVRTGDLFVLSGGLNIMDPPLTVPPGELLGCLNFEPGIIGGYRRCDGYERYDGHASPTDTSFTMINFTTSAFTPAAGTAISESGSGATGVVAYLDAVNSNVILIVSSGTFVGLGSTLTAGAQTATSVGTPYVNGAPTNALANTYYYEKWLYLQSAIGPVGGAAASGAVLGCVSYASGIYAFRNNAAGTQALMFQGTSAGWVQVALGIKVRFSVGIYNNYMLAPADGTVLVGLTSGATFTINRTGTLSGTWGIDAAGYFITASITGTPVANEALQVGGVTYATYLSNSAQTLPAGGTYYFRTHNFDVAQNPTTGFRLYGVNGIGNGFEFDGTTFTLIETGMSPDTPTHLEIHADYLFFAFPSGSLQNSGYQLPLNWNPVFGADERSVGEPVTFMREDVSQTLVIGTRRRIWTLVGLQVSAFQIRVYASNTGAYANTDENVGQILFAEDRGITTVAAAAQYGDFEAMSLSDKILKLTVARFASDTAVGAIVTRKKNLYRLIFASGAVLALGINASGKFIGWTQGLYSNPPSCVTSGFWENSSGLQIERAFFGSTNGYLYEIDKGRSFDGAVVNFFVRTAYNATKSPDVFKRYRRVQVDVAPEGQATVQMAVDADYGARTGQSASTFDLAGNGGFWDITTWDQFNWDSYAYRQMIMKLEAEGYNIGIIITGSANNDTPFTVSSVDYQYSYRIINRNTAEA